MGSDLEDTDLADRHLAEETGFEAVGRDIDLAVGCIVLVAGHRALPVGRAGSLRMRGLHSVGCNFVARHHSSLGKHLAVAGAGSRVENSQPVRSPVAEDTGPGLGAGIVGSLGCTDRRGLTL